MAKIDRTGAEKVLNVGPWKIKMSTFCALGLVIIMTGSSLGYIASELNKPKEPKQPTGKNNIMSAGVVIFFDENNTVEKSANINPGQTALDVFQKVASVETISGTNGLKVILVAYKNSTATNAGDMEWSFYVNSRLTLGGVDKYTVSNGDLIMLKYEQKLF